MDLLSEDAEKSSLAYIRKNVQEDYTNGLTLMKICDEFVASGQYFFSVAKSLKIPPDLAIYGLILYEKYIKKGVACYVFHPANQKQLDRLFNDLKFNAYLDATLCLQISMKIFSDKKIRLLNIIKQCSSSYKGRARKLLDKRYVTKRENTILMTLNWKVIFPNILEVVIQLYLMLEKRFPSHITKFDPSVQKKVEERAIYFYIKKKTIARYFDELEDEDALTQFKQGFKMYDAAVILMSVLMSFDQEEDLLYPGKGIIFKKLSEFTGCNLHSFWAVAKYVTDNVEEEKLKVDQ